MRSHWPMLCDRAMRYQDSILPKKFPGMQGGYFPRLSTKPVAAGYLSHLYSHYSADKICCYRIAVHLMRAVMTTSRPQIARNSEPFVLTFAVQGRAVFNQRSSGRWQPEAIAAGMSSSSMVGIPRITEIHPGKAR